MTSRRRVARFVADHLEADRKGTVAAAASWLASRPRAAGYLAQDVSSILAERGEVSARVVSAKPLAASVRKEIEAFLIRECGARALKVVYETDAMLLGGMVVEVPGRRLDASLKRRLEVFVERAR